jgi:acyl-[acyl-carrier-protein]-phospholipid O-acyltransferase/long-chain-fatty-acid--[acyl-carrier-protein] ligase
MKIRIPGGSSASKEEAMNESRARSTFRWLNATQFFGALNDNVFKFLIILFLIGSLGESHAQSVAARAGLIFVLPFLLFSHAAGILADRFSKRWIILGTKTAEIMIMAIGSLAFILGSPAFLYAVVFLMAAQSAFFGPSKYGIIPELVPPENISKANGAMVSLTFLAIIIGTALAPFLSLTFSGRFEQAGAICLGIAVLGTATAIKIKKTPAQNSERRFRLWFPADLLNTFRFIARDRHLLLAVLGAAYFLLVGAFVQMNIIAYGMEALDLSKENGTFLFLLTALGIGTGSFLAGRLSGRNIEFGIVPVGSALISISAAALSPLEPADRVSACLLVFLMGCGAGLFIVPLESFIQYRSPENRRGEILALSNFLSFTGVLLASLLLLFMDGVLGWSAARGFAAIGVVNLGLLVLSILVLPDFLLRFIALTVTRLFYKIDTEGIENVPVKGGALLISNHVSWVDALLLVSTSQRRIRFLMDRSIYRIRFLTPLFRLMGVIPISLGDSPRTLLDSLKAARRDLDAGYLVCIFAEGRISRSGHLSEFRKGFEKIMKGAVCPIIPVYIGGAWGSIFSYCYGKPLSRLPSMIPYPVSILFGSPMPPDSTALRVRLKVMELAGKAFERRKAGRLSLGAAFVRSARRNWRRPAVRDSGGTRLSFGKTLVAAVALKRTLRYRAPGDAPLGILLPASAGGVLANLAVTLAGRTAVNLNFTAGEKALLSAVRQAGIRTVITSRRFLEKHPVLPEGSECLLLEECMHGIKRFHRLLAFLAARFSPVRLIDRAPRPAADATAAVLFSSGTTSDPKGIELTHHNIASNVESLRMILKIGSRDHLVSALPFFHSFGFTGSIWFPLLSGFQVTFHHNPLDASRIVGLIRDHRATFLVATPTFLNAYMRRARKEDLQTLRTVIVGAAKLGSRTARNFIDRFGIQPLEGYGATELSPIACVNIPDIRVHGVRQVGNKPGTVGHPVPGVTVKIVDPDTGRLLPEGEAGELLVKGPNVMKGYLGRRDLTREAIRDGWYRTGDIASMDKDGFITIRDRLSRFSKIGGEMVPHLAVEETIQNALEGAERAVAVTAAPCERRGEKLVVLFRERLLPRHRLESIIAESDLPNLWKPKAEHLHAVRDFPLLGSGKLDLKAIRKTALERESRS